MQCSLITLDKTQKRTQRDNSDITVEKNIALPELHYQRLDYNTYRDSSSCTMLHSDIILIPLGKKQLLPINYLEK